MEKYDPYSIKQISFALRKNNTYFTVPTVLLSFGVLIISIIMNLDTVRHLWIPITDLPRSLIRAQTLPSIPLTSTLICYSINNFTTNSTYPGVNTIEQNSKKLNFTYVTQLKALEKFPQLAQQINGRFQCVDLAGYQFSTSQVAFYIQVKNTSNLSVSYYVQTTTIQNILYNTSNAFIQYVDQNKNEPLANNMVNGKMKPILVKFITASIVDTLYINADPLKINTLDYYYDQKQTSLLTVGKFGTANSMVKVMVSRTSDQNEHSNPSPDPFYTTTILEITRFDVGYIVGSILSWISTFSLILGFIIIPIMEKFLLLDQVQTLFSIQSPLKDPSFVRFIVASIKSGIFPKEDSYVKLSQQLEKRKDIQYIMKVWMTARSMSKFVPKGSDDVICGEDNFNDPRFDQNFALKRCNDLDEKRKSAPPFVSDDDNTNVGIIVKARKALLKRFDSGSDLISFLYKNEGHGSKESFCLSGVFLVGFLAFISIFGLFRLMDIQKQYEIISLEEYSYTFNFNQLVVSNSQVKTIKAAILDGNYNFITNFSRTLTYQNCNFSFSSEWYLYGTFTGQFPYRQISCMPSDITLVYSNDPSRKRMLYLSNQETGNPFYMGHAPKSQVSKPMPVEFQQLSPKTGDLSELWGISFKLLKWYKENELMPTYAVMQKQFIIREGLRPKLKGFIIQLDDSQNIVQETTSTIFAMVQTVWGFALICFTVILMKITKHINIGHKKKRMTPQICDFRENICVFLAKNNQLLVGRLNKELLKGKYYIKQQFKPDILEKDSTS